MGRACRLLTVAALSLLSPLTGCLVHTYKVQQPRMPNIVRDATGDELVRLVNKQSQTLQTLKAEVTFQVSVGGASKGKVTDYTSLSGYILLQSPEMLRVLGLLPVVHTPAFDLASDGKTFTLTIPHTNKAYIGTNAVTRPTANPIENLRPNIFFDTMILRPIAPDDLVTRTTEAKTYTDTATHHLMLDPEYNLTVVRRRANSQVLVEERVIHFDRTTLLPSEIDVYNDAGMIQTQATYGPYATFGNQRFPATITIKRPIDEYQIVLSILKLTVNEPLTDNQFVLKVPEGYTVRKLE